ncbi:30S ribosomal protein S16 [Candidatus Dojkabacteria bacterium]|nr:30S ribosomal protein S16 [Candidatus Dojkabacteria bacterium]
MVKIRLTRLGRKNAPFYRVIAIQTREKRDSRAIEQLGTYDPTQNPSEFKVDKDRVKYWLGVGAQPTDTVARFLAKEGLYKVEKKKFTKKPGKKKLEKAGEQEEEKKPEVKAEPVIEEKTEEKVEEKPEEPKE